MLILRSMFVGLVLAAGAVVVYQSQPNASSVQKDYLVRSSTIVESSLKVASDASVLSDWEFTARGRPAVCRFVH